MPGYYIGEIEVTDPDAYAIYRPKAREAVLNHGGEYVVAGGESESLEGSAPAGRIVILKFPSVEACKTWFHADDYAEAHAIRARAAISRTFVVEGLDLPSLPEGQPAGYYIGERDVHDDAAYKEYAVAAAPTIEAHGGAYMVKAGPWEAMEGEPPMPRVVVLRFPSVEACKGWYHSPEYHAVHGIRDRAATSRTFLAEGVA